MPVNTIARRAPAAVAAPMDADASHSLHKATAEAGRLEPDALGDATRVCESTAFNHLSPPPSLSSGMNSHVTATAETRRTKRSKRSSSKPRATVFSKRKGVHYRDDGAVLSCRFCEILRERDEPFLYEDEHVAVFRPLRPIVASHILIVPRAHIRNIHQLTSSHDELLHHMKLVAERVLRAMPHCRSASVDCAAASASASSVVADDKTGSDDILAASSSGVDAHGLEPDPTRSDEWSKGTDDEEDSCGAAGPPSATTAPSSSSSSPFKFAFHVPPFNSIDHVHMHAFRDERMGVFGRVKYRTESWWCRSFADVLARLAPSNQQQQQTQQQRDAVDATLPLPLAAPAVS